MSVLRRGGCGSLATMITASAASAALARCGHGARSFVARSRATPPPSMTAPQHITAVLLRSRRRAAVASLLSTSAPLLRRSAQRRLTLNNWSRSWRGMDRQRDEPAHCPPALLRAGAVSGRSSSPSRTGRSGPAPSLATRQANPGPPRVPRSSAVDRGTIATADGVAWPATGACGRTDAPCSKPAPTRRTGSPRSGSATRRSPRSRAGLEEEWNDYLTGANGGSRERARGPARQGAGGADDPRRQPRPQPVGQGAARGAGGPGRGRAGCAVPSSRSSDDHRRRAGDGVVADVRPQRRRPQPPPGAGVLGPQKPGAPVLNRGTAGPLPAGLDVQGRDGGGDRAQHRQGDAGHPLRHPGPPASTRRARPVQLPRRDTGGRTTSASASCTPSTPRSPRSARNSGSRRSSSKGWSASACGLPRSPWPTPADQIARLGPVPTGRAPPARGGAPIDVEGGSTAIGQERLLATPLQMCLVAASVANGGKLVAEPLPVKERVAAPGRHGRSSGPAPHVLGQAMTAVDGRHPRGLHDPGQVDDGTGTAATRVPGHLGGRQDGHRRDGVAAP